jgi:hypothetical protein
LQEPDGIRVSPRVQQQPAKESDRGQGVRNTDPRGGYVERALWYQLELLSGLLVSYDSILIILVWHYSVLLIRAHFHQILKPEGKPLSDALIVTILNPNKDRRKTEPFCGSGNEYLSR